MFAQLRHTPLWSRRAGGAPPCVPLPCTARHTQWSHRPAARLARPAPQCPGEGVVCGQLRARHTHAAGGVRQMPRPARVTCMPQGAIVVALRARTCPRHTALRWRTIPRRAPAHPQWRTIVWDSTGVAGRAMSSSTPLRLGSGAVEGRTAGCPGAARGGPTPSPAHAAPHRGYAVGRWRLCARTCALAVCAHMTIL